MLLTHDRADFLAGVPGASQYGGTQLDWTTPTVVAAAERVNVQPAGVTEEVANAQRVESRYELKVRPGVAVRETHRVLWDSGDGDGPQQYEIVAVKRWPRGTPGLRHTHVLMQRVQGG